MAGPSGIKPRTRKCKLDTNEGTEARCFSPFFGGFMIVKVGDRFISGEDEPVMIILTETDKENISNMLPDATKYCVFPDGWDVRRAEEFMYT